MSERERRDIESMREAMVMAELGRGRTSPNPRVGAVLVKNGAIVGRGYHRAYGDAHAEVNAIADAGVDAGGADLYVTLEPCCVWGNTPPCTDAIIKAGIPRVVTPMTDPNPDVSGRGVEILRQAGITVDVGCLETEARRLNEPYIRYRLTGLPLVSLKLAVTLDGRITAGASGERWISGEASRERGHAMRAGSDAVLVGIGTVLADDPELTDRRGGPAGHQPVRIVADSRLRTSDDARLVRTARDVRTVIACIDDPSLRTRACSFESEGVTVWRLPAGPDGRVDARALLRRAANEGMTDILCEGGATLGTVLLNSALATRLAVFVAPKLAGNDGVRAFGELASHVTLEDAEWEEIGNDVLFTAHVRSSPDAVDETSRSRRPAEDLTTCSRG